MNFIQHSAEKFKNEFHLNKKPITLGKLIKAARQNGYAVYFYTKSQSLMANYSLIKKSKSASGLSIIDENGNVLIFIDDKQSVSKQTFSLAHEIGHTILHKKTTASQKRQEYEANQFANYLLRNNNVPQINLISFVLLIVVFLLSISFLIYFIIFFDSSTPELSISNNSTITSSEETFQKINFSQVKIKPNSDSFNLNSKTTNSYEEETTEQPALEEVYENESQLETSYTSEQTEDYLDYENNKSVESSEESTPENTICYFTESGKVYHLYHDCSYIKNSKNFLVSTISNCKKTTLCSRCELRNEKENIN